MRFETLANVVVIITLIIVSCFYVCVLFLQVYLSFKEHICRSLNRICVLPSLITKSECCMVLMWFQVSPWALIWSKCLAKWHVPDLG